MVEIDYYDPEWALLFEDESYLDLRTQFLKAVGDSGKNDNAHFSWVGINDAAYYRGRHGLFVEAALRRRELLDAPRERVSRCGDLSIDHLKRRVTLSETPVHLTSIEFRVIAELAKHVEQVVPSRQLYLPIWGEGERSAPNLRTIVYRIKNKIKPEYIRNIPCSGYRLADPNQRQEA